MAARHIRLVNEWNQRAYWIRGGEAERQRRADSQWFVVELIVRAVFIARVAVAAVLHAVTKLIEGVGAECGLQRPGIDEIADAERVGSFDVWIGQAPRARLPAMVI